VGIAQPHVLSPSSNAMRIQATKIETKTLFVEATRPEHRRDASFGARQAIGRATWSIQVALLFLY
jgi:hypothetical protein